jgi:hypothetical protein
MSWEGFFLVINGVDCFLITNQVKKTKQLAYKFVSMVRDKLKLEESISAEVVSDVKECMNPATLVVTIEGGVRTTLVMCGAFLGEYPGYNNPNIIIVWDKG